MKEYITACPRNCYSTCSFRVQVLNGRIRRILPYKGNLATPEGPCIKGLSYIERTHSPERIIHPLIRKPDGTFQQLPAKEALDIIAEKLLQFRNEWGPASVFWYKGSGNSGLTNDIANSFWKAFGGATTTYGNLCWPAGLEAVRLTMGAVKHNVPWDLVNAKLILIWGKNPAETNIQEMAFINLAREKGARVIVVDPRRTATSDKADLLICPKPGTDAALALAIAGILTRESLIDTEFIRDNVLGYNEFRNALDLSPDSAEVITGIPSGKITELARLIGTVKPVTILPGYGLQRHQNGGQTVRTILSLAILTGNIGKTGAGFNYANLQSYVFDNVKEPLSYYPDIERDKPFRRTISMTRLGNDLLETANPSVKAVWIERGNPVLQSPDSSNVIKALSGMSFRVVVEQFMTDTAAFADIILPAKDIFEQSDIIGSYWSPYVQYKPKVIEPPGEVMPESEIYYNIASRLGIENDEFSIPQPGNENILKWLEKRIEGHTSLTLKDLMAGPVLAPDLQEIAYEDNAYNTPSGKIELSSSQANKLWGVSVLPDYIENGTDDKNSEFPLLLLTPNAGNRIHSQFGNLDIIKRTSSSPGAELSHEDASLRNISTGDKVRIFNNNGETRSTAIVSARIPKGSLILPNGIWLDEGGGGNFLIDPVETDMGFGAAFHDTMVQVEKTT